ncbi:hypothetical protein F53441_8825 [Fusarium austroafricanum]|uniref:Uncharacterized protein n=1 Tax=Fusarium austroafricanum TaxID=2364996 RepID=A0A8H4KD89_9HYPO|nr:hypothetical protein F53441_8825 [Fusarium austroafricanum]
MFIIAFPTFAGSMTGYTPKNEAYINTVNVDDEGTNCSEMYQNIAEAFVSQSKDRYQWGFSFLQLFVMMILLQVWSLGLVVMWKNAHYTLRLNNNAAPSGGWKILLEFTAAINLELEDNGMDPDTMEDKHIEHEIEQLLQGGSISSPRLTEGSFSTWRWIWKQKWYFLAAMFSILFIILENILRMPGLYPQILVVDAGDDEVGRDAIVFSTLYGTLFVIKLTLEAFKKPKN